METENFKRAARKIYKDKSSRLRDKLELEKRLEKRVFKRTSEKVEKDFSERIEKAQSKEDIETLMSEDWGSKILSAYVKRIQGGMFRRLWLFLILAVNVSEESEKVLKFFGYVIALAFPVIIAFTLAPYFPEKQNVVVEEPLVSLEPGQGDSLRTVFVFSEIYFDFGNYHLDPTYRRTLDKVARVLHSNPRLYLDLHGYADDVGDADANIRVSKRRAEVVETYLTETKGIDSGRMFVTGCGKDPYADDFAPDERSVEYRRVEFHVRDRDDKPVDCLRGELILE